MNKIQDLSLYFEVLQKFILKLLNILTIKKTNSIGYKCRKSSKVIIFRHFRIF